MPGLAAPVASPFYSGTGVSSLVPGVFDVAIAGRAYMIDWKFGERFTRQSIPLLKPQVDDSGTISERSLNPEEFARASAESWHHGAGQTYRDGEGTDPFRFRSSKGVDPWTRRQLSLLPDTANRRASANPNLAVIPVGPFLYVADGNEVFWTADITVGAPAWTAAAIHIAEVAQSVKSITSDGYHLYAALGSNGIHRTVRGATTSTHYSDLSATLLGYVKGRLMAANGNALFNVTASGPAPSALYTHPNTDFTWVGFAEGPGHIYAAGFSGDKSLVYRTAVRSDGTGLDIPIVAGELPDGEIIRSIHGYLGFLFVGTDTGLRLLSLDANGNVSGSSLVIPHSSPVRAFEPQGDFVWYGLSNYDAVSTGLGRASLRSDAFTAPLTPAYASDLMAAGQGDVASIATFQSRRVFSVAGLGIFAETTTRVPSGSIDSGLVTYGLPDRKLSVSLDVRHDSLDGSVTTAMSTDGGPFVVLGSNSTRNSTSFNVPTGQRIDETFEVRHTLTRSATPTLGPSIVRWTLESNPTPGRGEFWTVPLLLFERIEVGGTDEPVDVAFEVASLLALEAGGTLTTFQTGEGTYSVVLDDHTYQMHSYTERRDAFNGTFLAKLRRPRQRET